ncbi:carboxypeptidase-like regulatory domain-containing protein [Aeromicrobium erythreum]|uniref:carboxypeptidase-like regulatory domain-containing protein n=1 Tax=Aeromicrobium erythreum TaxID=2041 RepID=UPI000A98FD15|nr:carboxypeptidase-like regulatory domain-containing protein [Aeromicrobium erythreum]
MNLPPRPAVVLLLVATLLLTSVGTSVANEECARGCVPLVVVLEHPEPSTRQKLTVVRADDPERTVASTSFGIEGGAGASLPPGRYKIRVDKTTWWGGRSHATARVLELERGDRPEIRIERGDGNNLTFDVTDTRGDPVPFLRMNLLDAADPAQIVSSTTMTTGRVYWTTRGPTSSFVVEVVDLSGTYATRRVPAQHLTSVTVRPASGPAPAYDPSPGRSGEIVGAVSVADWDRSRVVSRLVRADLPTGVIASNEVYDPQGFDAGKNLRLRYVPPGRYKIQLTDGLWVGGDSHATASVIDVRPGETTRIVDDVPARGDVTGTVVSDRGVPLDGVLVTVFRSGDPHPVSRVLTGSDPNGLPGQFDLVGLPPADYQLRVSDTQGRIVPRWFGGADSRSSAAAFRPVVGGDVALPVTTVLTGLRATSTPRVLGRARVGSTLRATSSTWSVPNVSTRREWQRDGRRIPGATGPTYRLTRADRGHRIGFAITARAEGRPAATIVSRTVRVPR